MQTVGPSRAVGDAAAAETATDAAGEVAEAHPHVPIGRSLWKRRREAIYGSALTHLVRVCSCVLYVALSSFAAINAIRYLQ